MSLAISVAGCDCDVPGAELARDRDGTLTIGWDVAHKIEVLGVELTVDGATVWSISSEGTDPRVLVIGEPGPGFDTQVRYAGDPSAIADGVVIARFQEGGGEPTTQTIPITPENLLPPGVVAEVNESACSQDLDLIRLLGWLARAGLVAAVGIGLGVAVVIGGLRLVGRMRPGGS